MLVAMINGLHPLVCQEHIAPSLNGPNISLQIIFINNGQKLPWDRIVKIPKLGLFAYQQLD
jgi:hypothetical protein